MIRLLLTLLFLSGCTTMPNAMLERTPLASFPTNLNAEEFVECMNLNQPPKPPLQLFDSKIVWNQPKPFFNDLEVIYLFGQEEEHVSWIVDNGVAEMYTFVGLHSQWTQGWFKHYSSVCG